MNSAFILVCRKQPCEGEGLTSRYSTQTQKMKEMREEGREEWVVGSGVANGGQKGPSSLSPLYNGAETKAWFLKRYYSFCLLGFFVHRLSLLCLPPPRNRRHAGISPTCCSGAPLLFITPGLFPSSCAWPESAFRILSTISALLGGPFQAGQAARRRQGHTTAL